MHTPFLHLPGASRAITLGATQCAFLVTGGDTDGQVGLFELTLEPGARGAGLHIHKRLTEVFYVVEGEATLLLNDQQVVAQAGATMFVPPNTPHGFANLSAQPVKLLFLFWPPTGREQFFEGLAAMAQQSPPPSADQALAFMAQFDQYPV
ncbi:MAG: cupin domain-containing protein [Chloroflexales bacterium]|nr:cupin domain-containing protein [Chloroflexales bacterium]